MASKKKQEEVKQEEAPQSKRKASSDKMTATKKEEPMVKAEKKSKQEKTPTLVEQYTSLKEKHPDAMLLFRKGDFYLTVNEDAKKSSEILGITLTKPSQKVNGEHQAMFPYHALDIYLPKLIRAGVRVAIVDDMSQAKDQKVSANAKEAQEPKDKEKKEEQKEQAKAETEKKAQGQKEPRGPQLVTVNGEKVSYAHAFQSREISVEQLMQTYYPSKMEKKVSPEEYKADNKLSDGRVIDKMNVYKESNEQSPDFGKYKLYAVVGEQKMSTVMTFQDLNAYFDRVTTPARLVEKNFGEKLHLASAYEKYKLPEDVKVEGIRIAKDRQSGQWNISADLGKLGVTTKKPLEFDDGFSYFTAKTASREQLAAKYLNTEIKSLMAGQQKEQSLGMKI